MAFFTMLANEVIPEVIEDGTGSVGNKDLRFVIDASLICCYWLCLAPP